MSNLKRPIFWVYILFFTYSLLSSVVTIVTVPHSSSEKIALVLLVLLLLIIVVAFVFAFSRYQIEGSGFEKLSTLYGSLYVLIGMVFVFFGGSSLYIYLTSASIIYKYPWQMWANINMMAMCPFGLLILVFSVISLVSNKKPRS